MQKQKTIQPARQQEEYQPINAPTSFIFLLSFGDMHRIPTAESSFSSDPDP